MKSSSRMRALAALAIAACQGAAAFETPVHMDITRQAFFKSVTDRNFLRDLGVLHVFDLSGNLLTEPYLGVAAFGWVVRGSQAEDSFPRSLFHFYDPLDAGSGGLFGTFQSAPDWAFNVTGNNPLYSLPGTRDSFHGALTNTDTIVRPKMWRDAFRGVGQFTHLLQDMAQPQHVRNDDHLSLSESAQAGAFPDWSRFEKHLTALNAAGQLNFSGYPSVVLPTYRSYWNTVDDKGLAQHTNLNYVSAKTNLDSGKYGSPLGNISDKEETIAQVFDVFGNPVQGATNVTVRYVSYAFTDRYTGSPVINDRLSTYSLFDFQRFATLGKHAYTLYNTNHRRYAELLVPRAVGYSAGLINRFFRGSLEITRPDQHVYGIVDHAVTKQTDAFGFVGFDTIKLKVRNATANGEAINGGKLVAVAKFRRNGCYKDDLTGEFDPANPCPNYPTPTEEIVVSNEYTGVSLSSTAPTPFTFTFAPRQIPLNATDLYIQVVYRGPLGSDPDELAVGTRDVHEPTFLAIFNSTDHILFNGTWVNTTSPSLLPALDKNNDGVLDAQYDRANMDIYFGFADAFVGDPLGTIVQLPPARFSRMVLLTDRLPTYPAPIQSVAPALNTGSVFQFQPERNQLDLEANVYRVSVFTPLRGVPAWNSLTYFRSEPFQQGDLNLLPPIANKAPFPLTTLTFKP